MNINFITSILEIGNFNTCNEKIIFTDHDYRSLICPNTILSQSHDNIQLANKVQSAT